MLACSCFATDFRLDAQQKFFPAAQNGVPEAYIVILERQGSTMNPLSGQTVAQTADRLVGWYRNTAVLKVWDKVLVGFLAKMTAKQAEDLSAAAEVRRVDQDVYFSSAEWSSAFTDHCYFEQYDNNPATVLDDFNLRDLPTLPGAPLSPQSLDCMNPDPQSNPSKICSDNWGLDRIRGGGIYLNYPYHGATGAGVRVYMLDSGIRATNREFLSAAGVATRVVGGVNKTTVGAPNDTSDCQGHGTHTAGIVGGRTYGVAKEVTLVPVKFQCGGPALGPGVQNELSWLIDALHWIGETHTGSQTEIVNWSGGNATVVGNPTNVDLVTAVHDLIRNNPRLLLVQSAGNQRCIGVPTSACGSILSACHYTFGDEDDWAGDLDPAAAARVLVAGGTDSLNEIWIDHPGDPWVSGPPTNCVAAVPNNCRGSNGGSCVDIFAPAAYVTSASYWADNGYCHLSGTSMAAPHVAGAAAIYLQNHPNALPEEIKAAIVSNASIGALGPSIGPLSPNRLLRIPELWN
jgi:subtilisin family serine protease